MELDLKSKTLINISYNALGTFCAYVLQFLSNIVLSRNLTAVDYGLVGFAYIIINFLSSFEDLGINSAVIQREKLNDESLATGLTIKTIISVSLFIISVVFAPFAQSFFDNKNVVLVIRLLSLNFLINLFSFFPNTILTRNLNYKKINLARLSSRLINSLVSIILAISGFKYLSIVIANIIATLILVLVLNYFQPKKIRFAYNKQVGTELFNYGWRLSLSGIIIFIIFNTDNFVIGLLKGSNTLGYYIIAFNWGSMICSVLGSTIHEVLFPTFAKLQKNIDSIRSAYLRTIEYVSFFSIFSNILLMFISRDFLFFILGKGSAKWIPAISAFRILCIYGIVRSILEPIGNVIMALGRTDVLLKANLVAGIFEVGLIYPVVKYGNIEGVAVLVTIAYFSQYFIYSRFIKKTLKISIKDILGIIRPSLFSILIMIPFYFIILSRIETIGYPALLALKILVFAAIYILIFGFLTKWSLYKDILAFVKQLLHSRQER
jgi:O-antigen/teichoic acid export membrane protein